MKKTLILSLLITTTSIFAADYSGVIEKPDASKMIERDILAPVQKYTIPTDCITQDKEAIARGRFIFHNLNEKKAAKKAPKGLLNKNSDGSIKQYGNCVACHNIENAIGAGNIGPDLSNYLSYYIKTGARDTQFLYQKIADARVDYLKTNMTINLTTNLLNEREICDIASYILTKKQIKGK